MADVHDRATRSYNMSRIRSRDTQPEILVRKFLFSKGYRYRLYDKKLPGKPDLVLPKYNTVLFIHGCFWHGHKHCSYFVTPKTRTEWWLQKIEKNKRLDEDNFRVLKNLGWNVLTIFECDLKKNKRDITLNELINKIH